MTQTKPIWRVLSCGRSCKEVADWEEELKGVRVAMTAEEKKSRYAKYFYRDIVEPAPDLLLACERGRALPDSECFLPEQFAEYMGASKIDRLKSGYCVMENGIGYSAARIVQKGITDEVMQVFLDHFRPEYDLFYKLWYPNVHTRHYSDMAIENVGRGLEAIFFTNYMDAERLGVTEEGMDPQCIGIDGGVCRVEPLHQMGGNSLHVIETCFYREIPEGRETIIHFWHGLTWKDGQFVRMIPEGDRVNIMEVRALYEHSAWEYTQQTELILAFYQDWKNGCFD